MTFETDENGRPKPNAYVQCAGCGEATGITVIAGTADDITRSPAIAVWCPACAIAREAEDITGAAMKGKQS